MLSGIVASAEHSKTSKTGWKEYTVAFENGETEKVSLPPDSDFVPTKGQMLHLKQGKFGLLVDFTLSKSGGDAPPSAETSDGYWRNKFNYESKERDPKIELQNYFERVCEIYVAALPNLKSPPKTIGEVDDLITEAMSKAKALYMHVQELNKGK